MFGAIIGDVAGSIYEFNNCRHRGMPLFMPESHFTDDTVCTVAVMDWLLHAFKRDETSMTEYMLKWTRRYPDAGYGNRFNEWIHMNSPKPYNSYGNGAAMRISPVAWVTNDYDEMVELVKTVTNITHNHPEGIKGAETVATCIFMAKNGKSIEEIREYAIKQYPHIKTMSHLALKEYNSFNETCQGSVPEAIFCFLISNSYYDTISTAISIGGDSDTIAAIAGSIAEAYWGIPEMFTNQVRDRLDADMLLVIDRFYRTYVNTKESPRLDRFVKAQSNGVYEQALKEIKSGKKYAHWMWFIFPQIKGLGKSANSEYYGLDGLREAELYYNHPILGQRLVEACQATIDANVKQIEILFGYIDSMKLKSCVTLFYLITRDNTFKMVLDKYFEGDLDKKTMVLTVNKCVKK